jgi:branched-chain amino acid transport system substrate-binding protein
VYEIFVFLLLITLIIGMGSDATAQKEDINLGVVMATTGRFALAEASLLNGTKMAIEEINSAGGINGRKIKMIFEDTGSELAGAVNAFNRVAAQKPVAVVNTALSTFCLAQMADIKQAGIPTFPSGSNPKLTEQKNPWLIRIRTSDKYVVVAATKFVLDKMNKKKIGLLRVSDEYGEGWETGVLSVLAEKGLKPVGIEIHSGTDKDMTPHLLKLKNAGMDALIVSSHPTTHALIMKQRKQLGIDVLTLHSNSAVMPGTLKLVEASESEGIYAAADGLPEKDPDQKIRDWAKRYKEKFKMEGDYHAASCYDGVMMIAEAIENKGTDPKAIRDYFMAMKGRQGMGNYWKFDETGEGGRQIMIVVLKNNTPEPVERMVVQ